MNIYRPIFTKEECYSLFNKDVLVGIICHSNGRLSLKPINRNSELPAIFYENYLTNPELIYPIPENKILQFIHDRVTDVFRGDLLNILESYNEERYSEWNLFVKSSGMSYIDNFWINSHGAMSYSDHIRNTHLFPIDNNLQASTKRFLYKKICIN